MKTQHNIQWSVIFIISTTHNSNFIGYSQDLFKEILATYLAKHVTVILSITTPISNLKKIDPTYSNPHNLQPDTITSAIYSIKNTGENEGKEFTYVSENRYLVLQDGAQIAQLLSTIKNNFPADRYMLFTWDHGSGYGIFDLGFLDMDNRGTLHPVAENNDDLTKRIASAKIEKYLRSFNSEGHLLPKAEKIDYKQRDFETEKQDTTPLRLTMRELNAAIKYAFGEKKLDIILMANCFMQIVDTGFELAEVANYLVAPESVIVMNGYNYIAILSLISNEPNVSAKKIARTAIKSYRTKNIMPSAPKEALTDVTISAIDLKYYYVVTSLLDNIATFLTVDLIEYFPKIMEARNTTSFFATADIAYVIDPLYFFNYLAKKINNKYFYKMIKSFNIAHKASVKYMFRGQKYRPGSPWETSRPSGFSVYFPKNKNDVRLPLLIFIQKDNPDADSFAKCFAWDNFVLRFAYMAG